MVVYVPHVNIIDINAIDISVIGRVQFPSKIGFPYKLHTNLFPVRNNLR